MDQGNEKIIGILGGMGPEATALFFNRLVAMTLAEKDQEHPKTIIYSNPSIPDRTEAILGRGPSPVSAVIKTLNDLGNFGASFVAIPCVTTHYFFDEIIQNVNIPIINIVRETTDYICEFFPRINRIGLLATTGTVEGKVFAKPLKEKGLDLLLPSATEQKKLMGAIYGPRGIKAGTLHGKPRQAVIEVAEELAERGAEVVIAGCTEISLVLNQSDIAIPIVDVINVLARAAIKWAGLTPRQ